MAYDLPTVTLGRTGLVVTRLGIGGAYCKTVEGYSAALDCGVTYVDTARDYRDGDDERVIGEAIAGRRDALVLATKTQRRDAGAARKELETSLRLLNTDYVDIWQLHYVNTPEDRERVLAPGGAMEAAVKAREEGLVRFIGVTGHDWAQVGECAATGVFDTVLCWYNCAMREPEQLIFPHTQAHDMGVVIMSAGRNDKLFAEPDSPPAEAFYRYVLSNPAVHVTLLGLRDLKVFSRLAEALSESDSLPESDRRDLEVYGARLREAGKLNL